MNTRNFEPMFSKILVANRGEIALRVMRTCREMNIKTIAVFSEVDRTAPHVLFADEAYEIGPAPAQASYLRAEKILEVAKQSHADAVHPGYGFLSENTNFSKDCLKAGITFIGPSAKAIHAMGDKTVARQIMENANVPIIPGLTRPVKNFSEVQHATKQTGFPALIKAAGGGGGKGMRIVHNPENLQEAYKHASSEAQSAFNDSRIYVEKYLVNPRHIEFQILADQYGNVLSLGERECSIQRRFQKIVEESPSPAISEDLRKKMAEAACNAAKAVKYEGAGTIEFMLDENGKFYFLEMNTRLQVEHPITELRFGVDLVAWQIRIANGEKLPQSFDCPRGHAIECRIYAEDSFNHFAPSTGKILEMRIPDGYGVRFDGGVVTGSDITPYYDPMLGKLIVHASTRNLAIERMCRALSEFQIAGVETSIPLCASIMRQQSFRRGNYSTAFLDANLESVLQGIAKDNPENKQIAGIVGALYRDTEKPIIQQQTTKMSESKWKQNGKLRGLQ